MRDARPRPHSLATPARPGGGRVDLLKGSVRVQRQLDEHGAVQPLKYPASYRTLPLREVVSLELAAHLTAHGGGPGPVFRGHYGQTVSRYAIGKAWVRALARAGGDPDPTFHDLRHVYASTLIAAGESVKTVQRRMGHRSAAVTLDVYTHLWPDSEETKAAVDVYLGNPADFVRTREAEPQVRGLHHDYKQKSDERVISRPPVSPAERRDRHSLTDVDMVPAAIQPPLYAAARSSRGKHTASGWCDGSRRRREAAARGVFVTTDGQVWRAARQGAGRWRRNDAEVSTDLGWGRRSGLACDGASSDAVTVIWVSRSGGVWASLTSVGHELRAVASSVDDMAAGDPSAEEPGVPPCQQPQL